jgi:DNA-binding transcriptional MerR regulator
MSRVLRIAEVCRELGRSPDCIRDWVRRGILPATRAPSGQLQFDARDVQAIKRGDMAPALEKELPVPGPTLEDQPGQPPEPRRPKWEDLAPWDQEVHQAKATVEVERLNTELEGVRAERNRSQEVADRAKAEEASAKAERERLTRLKQQARVNSWIPSEIEARVIAEIERFVTSEQVPAWLPGSQQTEIVMGHVRRLVSAWSQEQTAKMISAIEEHNEKARREREKASQDLEQFRQREVEKRKQAEAEQARAVVEKRAAERARRRAEREGI